ncbi:hypothetical protein [Rhizobium leucaenae]|uniref:hypothetical protein n=1 Tax=Rhizobium leucaenae TaxID=29450 RepID=UPI0012B5ED32|nr:hypothetical protein [Rhizobium leucaenae]
MRIRLLTALSGVMRHYKAGKVVEWDDADALRLIERGLAVAEDVIEETAKPARRAKK